MSNNWFQKAPVQKAGHDGEVKADIDEGAAERATANLAPDVLRRGHKQFEIVRAEGSDGRFAALGAADWSAGCSGWREAGAGGVVGVRVRGVGMLMSRPVAARASGTRSSAAARRMPRLRWARIQDQPPEEGRARAILSGATSTCEPASWQRSPTGCPSPSRSPARDATLGNDERVSS